MSIDTVARYAGFRHATTDASVGGRTLVGVEVGEVGERQPAGTVTSATAPAELASSATTTPEVRGVALYGAARLDSTSYCARVTAPRASGVVLPEGFAFRFTLTRAPDAAPADVAVSDWMDLVVTDRSSTGERLHALPGDSARIGSGETWTYDVRLAVTLAPGRGRSMKFAESPSGRGWTATFAELDESGVSTQAGETHTF